MKKILLPTDFSENAENAMAYALDLFKDEVCRFYLLNTFMPSVQYDEIYPWHNDLKESNPQKSRKRLESLSGRLSKKTKSHKYTFVIHSAMNTMLGEMKKIVKKEKIDLVVMGTHGATGVKNKIFGSNTTQAIRKMTIPLIAVPSDFTFQAPNKILFPTGFEVGFSKEQLAELLYISKHYQSHIAVLHVSTQSELTEEQRNNRSMLEEVLSYIDHRVNLIFNESVRAVINEFQLNGIVNFLVMIKNNYTFFERLFAKSELENIGLHIKVPLLVIPYSNKK